MEGFGCFIVTLLSCLNLGLFLISEGYCSQARDAERQRPLGCHGGPVGRPFPRLKDLSQVATSQPKHVLIVSLLPWGACSEEWLTPPTVLFKKS